MPPRPSPPAHLLLGRRAVATGLAGAAALALTGCDVDGPEVSLPGDDDTPGTSTDQALVRAALDLCDGARQQLHPLALTPALRARLTPLVDLHRAHADALVAAVPGSPSAGADVTPVAPSTVRTLRDAVSLERRAHDRLVALAQRAESGRLARLLASMAAAISQRLVAL